MLKSRRILDKLNTLKLENDLLRRENELIRNENARLKPLPRAEKQLVKLFDVDGKVSVYVVDKATIKSMGRYEHANILVDVYVTTKGNVVLHKFNPITNQWTYYLPTDEEKEIYANALINSYELTEI